MIGPWTRRTAGMLVALVILAVLGLWLFPPALLRVGTGYAAKIVCSNVFLAGRDPEEVLAADVQAPGNPLLRLVRVSVDVSAGEVRAGLLGFIGGGFAVDRSGYGCTAAPEGRPPALPVPPPVPPPPAGLAWPSGSATPDPDPRLAGLLDDARLTGPGMRAVVVIRDGRLVGERYGPGFSAATPLLGWSMTKTVNAALVGIALGDGRLSLDRDRLFPGWTDARAGITLADLMAMTSGLAFNEDYGDVTDVTRMLYLEPDMAGFAAAKPLEHPPGTVWSYSSGTSAMLARLWQDAVGPDALGLPRARLFGPLGMVTATFETDASGTYAGSSYLYASGRDWARFGQFLLQDGTWDGRRLLPEGFVTMMTSAVPASHGEYGRGQIWLQSGDPDPAVPADDVWLRGHDGQYLAIVPSQRLVVVRLGLTPADLGYDAGPLVAAVVKALGP